MSRILYYDCFAGISGDMNLAALIDLGVPVDLIVNGLSKLGIDEEFDIHTAKSQRNGICGTSVHVSVHGHHHGDEAHPHTHRTWSDIREMIRHSGLSEAVKNMSIRVFEILARAEGRIHGKPGEDVHFHEVGATDSIVDIVGSCIALDYLACDKIYSSTVELGSGTVRCAHGVMPVPAPATLLLSQTFPSSIGGTDHEATTPTGAAFLAALADGFNQAFSGKCMSSGIGIGSRESDKRPNILRASIYETDELASGSRDCVLLEANLDDMTPEHISYLCEKLFAAGAMDVWQEPITMKKSRLGVKVCALASRDVATQARAAFFRHSSTLGLREIPVSKHELNRETVEKSSPYGTVKTKRAFLDGELIKEKPEFDDCRQLADENNLTIGEITDTIQREY